MTREEARKKAKVMLAYANGKEIEIYHNDEREWTTIDDPSFNCHIDCYRIKPEPKYRPFKDAKECWQEMLKHQPLGWVQAKRSKVKLYIFAMDKLHIETRDRIRDYKSAFEFCDFIDGTPFGIKEEES